MLKHSLFILLLLVVGACKLEDQLTYPEMTIRPNWIVKDYEATVTTEFVSLGNTTINIYGICWNKTGEPTTRDSLVSISGQPLIEVFSSTLSNLSPSSTYYVRAFSRIGLKTFYSNQVSFKTLPVQLPDVATGAVSDEAIGTLSVQGTINTQGASTITEYGHCWGLSTPTINNQRTIFTSALSQGNFTSQLRGLSNNTKYIIRAYAKNAAGVSYGKELTYITSCKTAPSVVSGIIDNISTQGAIANGLISNIGCSEVTEYGHCWSTSPNPSIQNQRTIFRQGSAGSFSSALTDLNSKTVYYIRAYAINSQGISYGNQVSIITL
ncbi:MAG: hypothetical protein ACOVQ4_21370 [Flectobacillus sp.]|uniref:hypothetical protein n=1 Tax=Flectobacillus sp. TaxID=50419 RepID=UPI003B9C9A7E